MCVSDSITRIGVGIHVGLCPRSPYFGANVRAPIGQRRLCALASLTSLSDNCTILRAYKASLEFKDLCPC